jgi:hypothetical protein
LTRGRGAVIAIAFVSCTASDRLHTQVERALVRPGGKPDSVDQIWEWDVALA